MTSLLQCLHSYTALYKNSLPPRYSIHTSGSYSKPLLPFIPTTANHQETVPLNPKRLLESISSSFSSASRLIREAFHASSTPLVSKIYVPPQSSCMASCLSLIKRELEFIAYLVH